MIEINLVLFIIMKTVPKMGLIMFSKTYIDGQLMDYSEGNCCYAWNFKGTCGLQY